jgi:hypothetical protein
MLMLLRKKVVYNVHHCEITCYFLGVHCLTDTLVQKGKQIIRECKIKMQYI